MSIFSSFHFFYELPNSVPHPFFSSFSNLQELKGNTLEINKKHKPQIKYLSTYYAQPVA